MNSLPHAIASALPSSSAACAVSSVNCSFAISGPPNASFRRACVARIRLTREDEGDLATAEFARDIAERCRRIGIAHRVRVAARARCTPTRPAPHVDRRVDHFEQQACAVLDRAAICIGAVVGAVLQELVEQVAVRAVDLDTVEAGGLRVFRTLAVRGDDARDFVEPSARGVTYGRCGRTRLTWPPAAIALGATGRSPFRNTGSEIRPTCQSCSTMRPPAACTACVTCFQPSTCSSDQMPGCPRSRRPAA